MVTVNTDYPFVDGHMAGTDLTIHIDSTGKINPDPGCGEVGLPTGQEP